MSLHYLAVMHEVFARTADFILVTFADPNAHTFAMARSLRFSKTKPLNDANALNDAWTCIYVVVLPPRKRKWNKNSQKEKQQFWWSVLVS